MVRVTAATSFQGNEGMWRAGETKEVSAHRAHELIENGLVIETRDQTSPLQQVADAIGATVQTTDRQDATLQAAADAIGAQPVTTESLKGKKKKPFEDRAIKPDATPLETK